MKVTHEQLGGSEIPDAKLTTDLRREGVDDAFDGSITNPIRAEIHAIGGLPIDLTAIVARSARHRETA
jgi:hypothetical protein